MMAVEVHRARAGQSGWMARAGQHKNPVPGSPHHPCPMRFPSCRSWAATKPALPAARSNLVHLLRRPWVECTLPPPNVGREHFWHTHSLPLKVTRSPGGKGSLKENRLCYQPGPLPGLHSGTLLPRQTWWARDLGTLLPRGSWCH